MGPSAAEQKRAASGITDVVGPTQIRALLPEDARLPARLDVVKGHDDDPVRQFGRLLRQFQHLSRSLIEALHLKRVIQHVGADRLRMGRVPATSLARYCGEVASGNYSGGKAFFFLAGLVRGPPCSGAS